ncbi:MAG: hypothetical protein WC516_01935 [Patescibacteria group bacterium]
MKKSAMALAILLTICWKAAWANDHVGSEWVMKVPYACMTILDTTPPVVKSINVTQRLVSEPIKVAYDFTADNLSGVERVSLLVRVLPTGDWIDTGVSSTEEFDLLSYLPGVEMWGKELAFAVQALDRCGNLSMILEDRPTGWFSFPSSDKSMVMAIKVPFRRQLSEYLWAGPANDGLIGLVGLGGPHGWGLGSTDIIPFTGLPIIGLPTALDDQDAFRGTPFIGDVGSRISYFNLGPAENPIWDFWFGANNHLVSDDGLSGSVISFGLDDYESLPEPQADFFLDQAGRLKLRVNPHSRYLGFAFFGLEDQSQIKDIGVIHYYLDGGEPWSYIEKISFEDWPVSLPVDHYRLPDVRVVLVAITQDGTVHWANISAWRCTFNGKAVSHADNTWRFTLP